MTSSGFSPVSEIRLLENLENPCIDHSEVFNTLCCGRQGSCLKEPNISILGGAVSNM